MPEIATAWRDAAAALPPGWKLQGLRCTSRGLAPDQRDDAWIAEACGPANSCVKIVAPEPVQALRELLAQLESAAE